MLHKNIYEQTGEETRLVLEEGDGRRRIPLGQQVPSNLKITVK